MNRKPVYTFAKWQVKEGRLDAVLEILAQVAAASRREEGNLFYKVHQSNAAANTLVLFEGYADAAAVEAHRHSDHFQQLVMGKIIPQLEAREVILASEINVDV